MIITEKVGKLEYLTAEGITAAHCFTTRLGGVSTDLVQKYLTGAVLPALLCTLAAVLVLFWQGKQPCKSKSNHNNA